jgi:hypothetical protein
MATQAVPARSRRKLRFRDFDEVVAEAERVHAERYVPLGNWSLGQTVTHLGRAMHGSIDGPSFRVSRRFQILGRLVLRYLILYWQFPPGAKLPRDAERRLVPAADADFAEGMETLRLGIHRLQCETKRIAHPVIGPLSVKQWNRFHLRHAELHLGFFVPPRSSEPERSHNRP